MIRNLKAMGLALVALFALSAVVASAASAEEPTNGKLTADGPFYLLGAGEEIEGTGGHFTYFNESTELTSSVTCLESNFTVEGIGGGAIQSGAETVTVTPVLTECISGSLPSTITMNGCDFVFHIGETVVSGTNYTVTADLKCQEEKDVVVEVYSGTSESIKLCTITFTEEGNQGLDATEGESVTVEEVETNLFRLTGTLAHITVTKSGLCGHEHTSTAEYDLDVTFRGYEAEEEEETHVSLTH